MKRIWMVLLLLPLLAAPVQAHDTVQQQAEILHTDSLYDGLDPSEQALLGEATPTAPGDFGKSFWNMFTEVLLDSESALKAAVKTSCLLLAVLLLCAFCSGLESKLSVRAVSLAGAFGITSVCAGSIQTMVGYATDTVDRISHFTTLLLPVMASVLTASGGVSAGTALYVGSAMFFDVLVRLIRNLLIPMVYAFVVISAAESAVDEGKLLPLQELIGWIIRISMKTLMYLFTAYLTLTGLITGTADETAVKAAKAALTGALPVVGGIVSGATESVLAGAAFLKSSVGVFGLLSLLAIGLTPFVRIAIGYLGLKLTTAVGGTLGAAPHVKLMGHMTTALGYLLAMTGCCVLMAMISCCCFMKAVNI